MGLNYYLPPSLRFLFHLVRKAWVSTTGHHTLPVPSNFINQVSTAADGMLFSLWLLFASVAYVVYVFGYTNLYHLGELGSRPGH